METALAIREPRTDQITDAPWDLVIFDEAHRVRRWMQSGSNSRVTKLYELAEQLTDQSYGVLLLTATPMQLSPYELWSSIELVEQGNRQAENRRRLTGMAYARRRQVEG